MPKSSRHWRTLRASPPGAGRCSATHRTLAPSRVIRRAMMRPMSPEPRTTTRRPTRRFLVFIRFWAVPAVYTPAGRVPGMAMAPRVRSRQPVASTTAPARQVRSPRRVTAVRVRSRVSPVTMAPVIRSAPADRASSRARWAYSGPVRASRYRTRPKPSWTHWLRMPPSRFSRSSTRTEGAPASRAPWAAAKPPGPPPTTTTSYRMASITSPSLQTRGTPPPGRSHPPAPGRSPPPASGQFWAGSSPPGTGRWWPRPGT